MQTHDSSLNLPTLEQAINRHPIIVEPDALLVDVLTLMGQERASYFLSGNASGNEMNRLWTEEETGLAAGSEPALDGQRQGLSSCVLVRSGAKLAGIFTAADVVRLTASGIISKQGVKISEVMTQPVITLTPSESQEIFTALLLLRQHQISHLPIVDSRGDLLGIVTPATILQAMQTANLLKLPTVGEVMNTRLVSATRTTSVLRIAQLMVEQQVGCVVITESRGSTALLGEQGESPLLTSGQEISSPASIPVGIVTQQKIVHAQALELDLQATPASAVMRRLGHELGPQDSLLQAYQQMQSQQMQTLLISKRRTDINASLLGVIAKADLLRALEPAQIYKGLKRAQQSVRQLQVEKTELLRSRNAELERQVQQRTAELQAALAKVEQQAKQAALINQIVQAIRGTLVLDEVLQTTAERLHEAFNVSRCLVFQPDAEGQMSVSYFSGPTAEREQFIGIHSQLSDYYKDRLAQGNQVSLCRIDQTLAPPIQSVANQFGIRAILMTPLVYQQELLGRICLHQCDREREWTASEQEFAFALADQCAIAIHRAKLYQQLESELRDRKQAQKELQQAKDQLQAVLDAVPGFVSWIDSDARYLGVNRHMAESFNLLPEAFVGQKVGFLNNPNFASFMNRFLTSPDASASQLIDVQTNGQVRDYLIASQKYNQGTIAVLVGIDITERKQALEALQRLNEELETKVEERTEVLKQLNRQLLAEVAERKQAQKALQKSEEQFRFLAEFIPQQVWIAQPSGEIKYVNQRTLDYFTCTQEQILGWGWHYGIHPEDLTGCLDHWHHSLATGEPFEMEFRLHRVADNTYRTHLGRALPMRDRSGRIVCWFGTNTDIDDRKQAEEALRESEERFRCLSVCSPVGIFVADVDGRTTYTNPRAQAIWGFSLAESLGDGWAQFVHPDDCQRVYAQWSAYAHSGHEYSSEFRIQTPEGIVRWVHVRSSPMFSDKGVLIGHVGTIEDITERQQREEALRQSEMRLRLALNAAQMGTWDWEISTGNLNWSERTEFIYGFAAGSFPGTYEAYLNSIHPEDRDFVTQTIARSLEDRIPYKIEHRLFWRDGSVRWVAGKGDVIRDQTGQPVGMSGVVMDITSRKQAEEALRDSEFKLRTIIENSNDAITLKDTQGRYLLINPAGAEFLGRSVTEILGKRDEQLFTPQTGQQIWAADQVVMASGIAWTYEEPAEIDGVKRIFLSTKCPYSSPQGELLGVIGICRDITQSKQAEETLRRQLAAVEAATDGIAILNSTGEFIYLNNSHVKIFGYDSASELMGKTWQELYSQDELERFERNVFPMLLQQGKWQGEATAKRQDGTTFAQEVSLTLIEGGGMICVCRDISDRQLVEEMLRLRNRAIAASSNGIIIADARLPDHPLLYVNPAFERMTGYSAAEVLGRNCRFLQGNDTNQPELDKLRATLREGKDCTVVLRNYRKDGTLFWNELSISPIYDARETLTHYLGIQTDITSRKQAEEQLKASLKEKEVLLKEIHHRVKNNLQVISSLLKLQSAYIKDEEALALFTDSYNRVRSMALIHEKLYQSHDLAIIQANDYIRNLVDNLFRSYQVSSTKVKLQLEVDDIGLDIDTAIPCGLIINELITNSFKYAFLGKPNGEVIIKFSRSVDNIITLLVSDDGVGLPPNFDIEEAESLGLQLVYNLTDQLGGYIEVSHRCGTFFKITFTEKNRELKQWHRLQ